MSFIVAVGTREFKFLSCPGFHLPSCLRASLNTSVLNESVSCDIFCCNQLLFCRPDGAEIAGEGRCIFYNVLIKSQYYGRFVVLGVWHSQVLLFFSIHMSTSPHSQPLLPFPDVLLTMLSFLFLRWEKKALSFIFNTLVFLVLILFSFNFDEVNLVHLFLV